MSAGILYGGDDIGTVMIDPGSQSVRVGYAQEDVPKAEIPSNVGIFEDTRSYLDPEVKPGTRITTKRTFVGTTSMCVPKNGLRIANFMKDGMIEDWDLFENVLDYAYAQCLHTKSDLHPLLMSECATNLPAKREKLMEIMFEKYDIPAFFLVKSAVLSAFANGRGSAMVVDSGASHTSAIPVHDGFVLTQAVVKTPLGGDFITMQCRQLLQEQDITVIPSYMVASKTYVKEREPAIWVAKNNLPDVTTSWHNFMVKRVIQDFQQSVLHISETPLSDNFISNVSSCHYEFPNGYHREFGIERYNIPEILFDPATSLGASVLGISNLVTASMGMCDVDIRAGLFNNLVITGGNTLIPGFVDRLTRDMLSCIPNNVRLKVLASNSTAERRFSSWIGGSILASIGTFQQMWISNQEYMEGGKSQIERKCP